jgi:hypothetical protein
MNRQYSEEVAAQTPANPRVVKGVKTYDLVRLIGESSLDPIARLVSLAIAATYVVARGDSNAPRSELARMTGLEVRRLDRALARIKASGEWIVVSGRGGNLEGPKRITTKVANRYFLPEAWVHEAGYAMNRRAADGKQASSQELTDATAKRVFSDMKPFTIDSKGLQTYGRTRPSEIVAAAPPEASDAETSSSDSVNPSHAEASLDPLETGPWVDANASDDRPW